MVGTFNVGDKVDQQFSGITISGKIASIDIPNTNLTITDITSTNELQLNFTQSDTYLVYNTTDNSKYFEISKIYDVDSTLPTQDSDLVMPHSKESINQELEKDINDYIEPLQTNPFWN